MPNDLLSVFRSSAPRQPKGEVTADHVWRIMASMLKLSNISMPQPAVVGAPPQGPVAISKELFDLLHEYHHLGRYNTHRIFYQDMSPDRFRRERDMWELLTTHRAGGHYFQIILSGEPGYKFPTHPQLGALYAGDHIWLVNEAFLIHRRSAKSNAASGGTEGEPGYYLLALSSCQKE